MLVRLSRIVLLVTLAACGASPTGPGGGPPRSATTVDRGEIVLTGIGETAGLSASANGQSTAAPSLALVSEGRWLAEAPVLDAAMLAVGRIVAAGPGEAELSVRAFGAEPARVRVRVAPTQPLVLSAQPIPGDTLVVRGYRLDAAGAASLGGQSMARIDADSATLRLHLPPATSAACVAGPAEPFALEGARTHGDLRVRRRHAGEVRLRVGETLRLAGEAARCLRLAPQAEATYALAFLDTRGVRAAEGAAEPSASGSGQYAVAIAENGQPAPSLGQARATALAAPDQVRRSAAAAASAVGRLTPWAAGDRFSMNDPAFGGVVPVRVVKVYGGHVVLAVAEDVQPAGGIEPWIARADSAFASLVEHGYPLFRAAFSASSPVTSAGSGQLLVVARPTDDGAMGSAVTVPVGSRRFHYVLLNSGQPATAAGLLKTLAHEVTHTWQERWAEEARPAGAVGIGAPTWAVEGNADLLSGAVLRRALSLELAANWDWASRLGDPGAGAYAVLAAAARGELTAGYASSASFQSDLLARLVRSGLAEEAALAEVSRGVLEGWHGWDRAGGRRQGLAARMGRHLGGWSPTDGVLAWALSQAADDLTANPELQNSAFARISTAGQSAALGWLPAATLNTGAAAVRTDPAAGAGVSGNAVRVGRRQGSPGYVRIEDAGRGGVYALSSGLAPEEVAWALVRVR